MELKKGRPKYTAGRLEKGEDPLFAAQRELREETGYVAKNWESLGYIFTTFGICDEKLYLFKATDLSFVAQDLDEGEFLHSFELPVKEVYNLVKNDPILPISDFQSYQFSSI